MSMVDAVLVATIVSYVLNRKWSFRTRGGRERHHEAALFFLVCGIGLVIGTAVAMAFRWWAFRRYVFPDQDARRQIVSQSTT